MTINDVYLEWAFPKSGLTDQILRLMTDPNAITVSVTVGTELNARAWTLYESLLCEHSEFFRKALEGEFKEAKEKKVNLPKDKPEVFELFVQWLYAGGYLCGIGLRTRDSLQKQLQNDNNVKANVPTNDMVQNSVEAWILGEKLRSNVGFKNYALNHLYHLLVPYDNNIYRTNRAGKPLILVNPTTALYVFQNTMENSKLQQFMRDYLASYWQDTKVISWDLDQEGWQNFFECAEARNPVLRGMNQKKESSIALKNTDHYFEVSSR